MRLKKQLFPQVMLRRRRRCGKVEMLRGTLLGTKTNALPAHRHIRQSPAVPPLTLSFQMQELWLILANTDWQVKLSALSFLLRSSPFLSVLCFFCFFVCVFTSSLSLLFLFSRIHLFLSCNPPSLFPLGGCRLGLNSSVRIRKGLE